ncbi:hypothetical protein FHS96_000794 [Sphingomonas zeicaulis]|uniref:YfiM family protein n=1 Tax=Sphingomonas zeicaulis TaxID=1632740 RepID=UPI003D225A7D
MTGRVTFSAWVRRFSLLAGVALPAFTAPALAETIAADILTVQPSAHFDFDLAAPSATRFAPVALPDAFAPAGEPELPHFAALQDTPDAEPAVGPSLAAMPDDDPERQRLSFGRQIGAIKWEVGLAVAYMTATNIAKVSKDGGHSFRFKNEGWFGDNTVNLGMDKLAHAWNTYWLTDLIEARIRHKSGASNAALPAAAVSMGLMLYSEMWDAHKETSGFSFQDVAMNAAGAGFSVLRNSVPGLEKKLDFRLLLTPNDDIYTFSGTEHYRQMQYILALKLSGFEALENTPLRFVELHAGYRATGFTLREEQRGDERIQRPFIGIGLNVNQLIFGRKKPRGTIGRAANEVLNYLQVPYTSTHVEIR